MRVDAYARRLEFEVKTVQYELGLPTYIATEIAPGSRLGQTKLYTTGGLRLQQVPDTDATHAFLMEEKCKKFEIPIRTSYHELPNSTGIKFYLGFCHGGAQSILLTANCRSDQDNRYRYESQIYGSIRVQPQS